MKVILAGYSKTGTKTMAEVFSMLGYKTYDFVEHLYYHGDDWNKIYSEGGTADDFRRMYEGVDAVTDTPVFYFWEQLHEAFPDAKIILTLRDEDSWYASMVNHWKEVNRNYIWWALYSFTFRGIRGRKARYNFLKFYGDVMSWPRSKVHPNSELIMRRMYREHNNYVQAKAPKDKLLVYRVSEGWEPLCKFLGVDVPDQPFPHKNKKSNVINEMQKSNEIVISSARELMATLGVISIVAGWCGFKLFQSWPLLIEFFLIILKRLRTGFGPNNTSISRF